MTGRVSGPVGSGGSPSASKLADRVGVLSAQIHALSAELVDAVAALDTAEGWQGRGYRTLAHWLDTPGL